MVEFQDWEASYERLLQVFHFSREEDEESAKLLSRLLPRPRLTIHELENIFQGNTVYIFGAHDAVVEGIKFIKGSKERKNRNELYIAADGACTPMRENNLKPDLIITDLDGRMEDILYWNQQGVPLLVHAHGDNRENIMTHSPKLTHSMATTQSNPFDDVHNFGGFTDGDRCVYLADHFGALRTILVGFDFSHVGKYSFTTNVSNKLRKLKFAKNLISRFNVEYFHGTQH